jgi:RNA polymerase sigma-70 factor (family 1)
MMMIPAGHTNEENFKLIFETYKNRLYGYVLAISHSHYVAEEITQEIFMKLWVCREELGKFDEAYIFTMARNRTLNHLRKANTHQHILQLMKDSMQPVANNVDEKTAAADLTRQISDILPRLSPQRRLVFQLSRDEGMNYDQIAKQMNLSKNTVRNHMVFALRYIRDYLQKQDILTSLLLMLMFF